MSYNLRDKNYPVRPARYSDSDWVTEFPRPHNRYTIRYAQWIMKLGENMEPLGYKVYDDEKKCYWCNSRGCEEECYSPPESEDENDSVCFRVPHDYNEDECSDNCPHKPEEEEIESWVCGECSGCFHATKTTYKERYCCEKCWDKAE